MNYIIILRYPTANPNTKNKIPIDNAIYAIYTVNASSSFFNGVSSTTELYTNPAIYPITVLSPVKMTTPLPVPYKY